MKARLCMCVLMALPFLVEAHCDSIEIIDTSWESSSSALSMTLTFTSKPGKIYELQGSPDLAGFSQLADVAGASVVEETTVVESSVGEDQYFFRIQVCIPFEQVGLHSAWWTITFFDGGEIVEMDIFRLSKRNIGQVGIGWTSFGWTCRWLLGQGRYLQIIA